MREVDLNKKSTISGLMHTAIEQHIYKYIKVTLPSEDCDRLMELTDCLAVD